MLKPVHIALVLCAALLIATMPTPSIAEEKPEPAAEETAELLKREATALFQGIIKDQTIVRGHCSLGSTWISDPVPYDVAHQYLGLTVHADLVPMYHGREPAEVIDPAGTMKEEFCDDDEASKRTNALLEEFKRNSLKTENGHLERSLRIKRLEFSFPVFDQDYKRAIIVVSGSEIGRYRRQDGAVGSYPAEVLLTAVIYVKQDGVWRWQATEFLAGS
ncbi:hypothetical protein [Microvirga rosea]|uniref:hypothetical protein n=1 Tax=Microvirga rosea TaxID=2715425 RepID=UPI001D0A4E43|nr:hypothetical protein [Microvirga rosea]MCB8823140.1 hypothetical protein [Microvirga rosea]